MKNLYESKDYKSFIAGRIEENKHDRAYRSKMVEAMNCQLSFFSQVMHSHVHITPDHAAALAEFWGFNPEDAAYFLDLVLLDRAANKQLKEMLTERLKDAATKRARVADRFKSAKRLKSPEVLAYYYGSWHVPAIHMIVSIEKFKSARLIAEHLKVPMRTVEDALEKLTDFGLIEEKKSGGWNVTTTQIHLDSDSPIHDAHLMNWVGRTIANIQSKDRSSQKFAIYCTMSEEDFDRLKREMASVLEKFTKEIVAPSKPEVLVCLNTNLFKV